MGAHSQEDYQRCLGHDLEISDQPCLFEILQVELNSFVVGEAAPPADLPEAREPRASGEVGVSRVAARVLDELGFDDRTGADQAQVASENAEQLGQLVEALSTAANAPTS